MTHVKRRRTCAYAFWSMRTLRFVLVTHAGRLTRTCDRHVLRMAQDPATGVLSQRVNHASRKITLDVRERPNIFFGPKEESEGLRRASTDLDTLMEGASMRAYG